MRFILLLILVQVLFTASAQQVADTGFTFTIAQPKYAANQGGLVLLDEAHCNFHRVNGRYQPFANVLRADGYTVKANHKKFTAKNLRNCKVLVIANALNKANRNTWSLPNPSAFTDAEIHCLQNWVKNGGKLFLIADHMPFAGAAQELGDAFGFGFVNGFAMNSDTSGSDVFTRTQKNLAEGPLTNGLSVYEKTDTIMSFTGSAFKIPAGAVPVLLLDSTFKILMPADAWEFKPGTPSLSGTGLYQGASLQYGTGKIVVFGEAGMFTAQISNNQPFGMNLQKARQNAQLLINIFHWLDN